MRYVAVLSTLLMLLPVPAWAQASRVDLSVSLEALIYRGNDYDVVNGKLAVAAALNYQFQPAWRIGAGVLVGGFEDLPRASDLTTVSPFGQVTGDWQATPRMTVFAGARAGWEHEHGGSLASNLGGYGWSAGPSAGVEVALTDRLFAGATGTWSVVHLGQGLGPDATSHSGHRIHAGGRIGVRW